jgi:fatty acid desaturase
MLMRHLHYGLMNALLLLNLVVLLTGGAALWLGFAAAFLLATLVDEAAGEDVSIRADVPYGFLNLMLFTTLPLIALNILALALLFGSGSSLGLVSLLLGTGIDVEAARTASGFWSLLGALMGTGLFVGSAATNVAHELTHRTQSPAAMITGRWLLAFSFDTTFSIEHVHGHHRHVCTPTDPASSRRGEYPLAFFLRSTLRGNISAWRIEAERLRRKGHKLFSPANRVITGQCMSLAILAAAFGIGGGWGLAAVMIVGVQGKLYLELVNFIEHYGLVRTPGGRIEARHSWNTYKMVSSAMLYNLPRHSHHHMFAAKPFWALEEEPEGPRYPYGYMTMILMSLVPPLWNGIVDPLLEQWDRSSASEAERRILAQDGTLSPSAMAQSAP